MSTETSPRPKASGISSYIDSATKYSFREGEEVKIVERGTKATVTDRKTIITMLRKLSEVEERENGEAEIYEVQDEYGINRRVNGGGLERV